MEGKNGCHFHLCDLKSFKVKQKIVLVVFLGCLHFHCLVVEKPNYYHGQDGIDGLFGLKLELDFFN